MILFPFFFLWTNFDFWLTEISSCFRARSLAQWSKVTRQRSVVPSLDLDELFFVEFPSRIGRFFMPFRGELSHFFRQFFLSLPRGGFTRKENLPIEYYPPFRRAASLPFLPD